MAYSKNYRRRRNYRRNYRRKYKHTPRKKDAFDYARSAWNGVMSIKRMVNVEYKTLEPSATGQTISSTGTLYDLCTIPVGDNQSSRDGISVKPINLVLRYTFEMDTAQTVNHVRIVVFRFKSERGAAVVIGDIFPATPLLKPKIYDKRFQSKTLLDKTRSMSIDGSTRAICGSHVIKLDGHINYDAATVDGTIKEDGGLYMFVVSDVTTNMPVFEYYARLTYTDN